MSVHYEISKKVKLTNQMLTEYKKLDLLREKTIEEVLDHARSNKLFSVDSINEVTNRLNEYANAHYLPLRKLVTVKMIKQACHQN